jgi:outer membrane protein assembly factor BamB
VLGAIRPLAALLLLVSLLAPAASADWASFHADARGSGYLQGSSYPVYQDVWWSNRTLSNAQVHASPVIKDGILITADLGSSLTTPPNIGLVRALDVESGHELWRYKMTAPVEGTPAIAGERVYVVDSLGVLKALNLRDGRVENTATSAVGATLSSIREHEGKLFIGTEAGEMKAYLASSLTLLWTFKFSTLFTVATYDAKGVLTGCTTPYSSQPIRGAAAIFDGQVFFGSLNHLVVAVDEEGNGDGTTNARWVYATGDVIVGAPSIDILDSTTHRLVVGSYDGTVYSFDPSPSLTGVACPNNSGTVPPVAVPVWTYEVPSVVDSATGEAQVSKVASSPANSGDRVFVGANNGHVYALDASTGDLEWEQSSTGNSLKPVTSSPAVANGIVVVGSEDKNVYWLRASNGTILKRFATQAAVATSPAIDGDRALVSATDGTTYMFGPKVPPRADLTVASVSANAATVTASIKNVGTDAAAATTVRLFVGGTFLANLNLGALAPGESQSVTYTGAIPPGPQSIKASVDPDNLVKESNESNNDYTLSVTIAAPGPAPTAAIPTTKKKSPEAGIAFAGLLLVCAAAARRPRKPE